MAEWGQVFGVPSAQDHKVRCSNSCGLTCILEGLIKPAKGLDLKLC